MKLLVTLLLSALCLVNAQGPIQTLADGTIVKENEKVAPSVSTPAASPAASPVNLGYVTATQCAAYNVFNACLDRAKLRKDELCGVYERTPGASQKDLYECYCANSKEVALCFINCSQLKSAYTLQLSIVKSYCDAAAMHGGNPDVGINLNGRQDLPIASGSGSSAGDATASSTNNGSSGRNSPGSGWQRQTDLKSDSMNLNMQIYVAIAVVIGMAAGWRAV